MHRHCYRPWCLDINSLCNSALSFSTGINGTPGDDSWPSLWVKQPSIWARNWGPHKNSGIWGPIPWAPLGRPFLGYSSPTAVKCQEFIHGYITLEWRGGTLTRTKWRRFMSLLSVLWLCTFQMSLIIYVSLLQKSWVCCLIIKTMPSCPGLTPTLHSTIGLIAGSAELSPLHQWKASRGGHLHFKEKSFSKSANTFNNNSMWCLFLNWLHQTTLRWTGATLYFNYT